MGPKILVMLALSALACASVVDTELVKNDTERAPSPCFWSGTAPFCAGSCDPGYEDCATSSCGDGACCVTGYKKYCCRGGCQASKVLGVGLKEGSGSPEDAVLEPELDGGDAKRPPEHKE